MKMFPRVLVISNNCFSKTDSNGRTLKNFFLTWPKDCLAQFYIQNAEPDFEVCEKYYRTTDRDVLNSILFKKNNSGKVVKSSDLEKTTNNFSHIRKKKRNALNMIIRNIIWDIGLWRKKNLYNWINEFSPEVILLQVGDCSFMIKLTNEISKKFNIPIVIYNSEGYYFKDFDYFRSKGLPHLLYPLFIYQFRKSFRRIQKNTHCNIYSCDLLKNAYGREFSDNSEVIYTSTAISVRDNVPDNSIFTVSYMGNLGVGRHKSLIEIAKVLQSINSNIILDVYGRIPNKEIKDAFDSTEGISYKGMVDYDTSIEIMKNSDLILHIECFDEFYKSDLRYAFSTKIADSLACGTTFLLYAPKEVAATKYLLDNDVAYVATNYDKLKEILTTLINFPEERDRYKMVAKNIVLKNHNKIKNSEKFRKIISEAVMIHKERRTI